ncbi:MAG: adenylyltransferase/cytidyltransferase family protein, partial [Oscillospiraceae bacterium]|nr:adenylyltransferase/cytidyltransferase family protein [Oscillospiraceae bacterium]
MMIGYTSGVFDLFHIGHLNLLKNAKGMCDKLVVGVTTDNLSLYKGKKPLIPFEDRIEIVRSIKYVDS